MKRMLTVALASALLGAAPLPSEPFGAMRAELRRATRDLKLQGEQPAYFAAYWVVDFDETTHEAVLGAMISADRDVGRRAQVELRVGDRNFDNSRFIGEGAFFGDFMRAAFWGAPQATAMTDPAALRHALWIATDASYKSAIEALEKKRAARQSESDDQDDTPSFSEEAQIQLVDEREVQEPTVDAATLAREVSAVFKRFPDVQASNARVVVSRETRYYVSNEASAIVVRTPYAALFAEARTQAADGMQLKREIAFQSAASHLSLPTVEEARQSVVKIAEQLVELRNAPIVEDYSGPVLFEGEAAPQVVYELLGEALSGTPPPRGAEGMEAPLARKRGKRVTSQLLSAFDDPTLDTYQGHDLIGHYLVDDEGRPAEKVSLIEDGRLRHFLMSRTPRKDERQSNGHGRSGLVGYAEGRIGNLIVTGRGGLTKTALRQRLLKAVREERGQFGLVVQVLEPRPSASSGQAVPVPQVVYRLHLDGREELVRGASFSSMSVRDLKDVIAVGAETAAYHFAIPTAGFAILTSVVAPSLLFEDVEIRKPTEPKKRPPVWPSPVAGLQEQPSPHPASRQQRKPVE